MTKTLTPAIRAMTRADLDRAIDWAATEGWNPGDGDGDAFFAADPGGFLIAEVAGKPAACISVVNYGPGYGFLGFYIARPEFRGQGIGLAIWNAGMARLGDRVIGLDGVVAQQDNYRKSGFALAHRNVRHEGEVSGAAPDDPRLKRIDAGNIAAVQEYDRAFFGGPREGFIADWCLRGGRIALALVDGGRVRGFGVIRACRRGHKIGPLFADHAADAELLFRALAARAPGTVILDIPEPNQAARELVARHGLEPAFETARMYRGPAPALPIDRTYGITTFELG